jgi:hypothetical protein
MLFLHHRFFTHRRGKFENFPKPAITSVFYLLWGFVGGGIFMLIPPHTIKNCIFISLSAELPEPLVHKACTRRQRRLHSNER